MGAGKLSAVILGFAVMFALGAWMGPHLSPRPETHPVSVVAEPVDPSATPPAPAPAPSAAPRTPRASAAIAPRAPRVAVSEPALHERLKPVLNRGANMSVAADGFKSAEEFATVAHAAHNTAVPFMLLKHRVLNEGKSVADAIHESKQDSDAAAEAQRARAEPRSDLASIAG